MLYNNNFNSNSCFNLFNMPIVFEHLFDIFSVCFLEFRLVSKVNHRKVNSSTLSIHVYNVYFKCKSLNMFIRHMKNHVFSVLIFNNNLLIFSNSSLLEKKSFIIVYVLLLLRVVVIRKR